MRAIAFRHFQRPTLVIATASVWALQSFSGCSASPDEQVTGRPGAPSSEELGSLGLTLTLANGSEIDLVHYVITGQGVPIAGDIAVDATPSASLRISALHPGDYHVSLTASGTNAVICAGEADFHVSANQTTSLTVLLNCTAPQEGGAAVITGVFNSCPHITSMEVAPLQVELGGKISVRVNAVDPDGNSLTYGWTAQPTGSYDDPTARSTAYNCDAAGNKVLTVTVSDGHCPASTDAMVSCITAVCGDGVVGPGEQCDPPDGTTCDTDCQFRHPGSVAEFDVPFFPETLTVGSLGTANPDQLWVSSDNTNEVMLFDVVTHETQVYPLLVAGQPLQATFIAPSLDGKLWLTEFYNGRVARFSPTTFDETQLPLPSAPRGIVRGPGGDYWACSTAEVVRVTVAGVLVQDIPLDPYASCYDIQIGPDGNLWATDDSGRLWRITPNGNVSGFDMPAGLIMRRLATLGNELWMTAYDFPNSIGEVLRFDSSGTLVATYPQPNGSSDPWGIVAGPDSNIWFTDRYQDTVNRLTTQGVVTSFSFPGATPNDIVVGPDNKIWFTEQTARKLGSITP